MAGSAAGAFAYAGLDFILDSSDNWHFLEANDHPVGLAIADRLSRDVPSAVFGPRAVDVLARALVRRAEPYATALLPPDAFRIAPSCGERRLHDHTTLPSDDGRADLTVDEFNSIIDALDAAGAPWMLANPEDLAVRDGLLFGRGERIGALYRRHQGISAEAYVVPSVNDIRLRLICPDKVRTAEVIASAGGTIRQPEARLLMKTAGADEWLDQRNRESDWVIVKPRHGTASQGVRRERAAHVRATLPDAAIEPDLVQNWIEPATAGRGGRPYRFDVRVFVIDGAPVAGFARTAAAPAIGRLADSPLSWLTTTGPLAPLVTRSASPDARRLSTVALSAKVLEDLDRQCRLAVAAIDSAVATISVAEAVPTLRPYQLLAGIEGEMRVIPLCGRVSSSA